MFYVDLTEGTFDLTLTLGDLDTNSPPPLLLAYLRHGTNEQDQFTIPVLGMIVGDSYVTYVDIPTSNIPESGQYDYVILDNTVPASPVEVEKGLFIATTTPITKKEYGTDKSRVEYKGYTGA